jgi:TolA-binding protein
MKIGIVLAVALLCMITTAYAAEPGSKKDSFWETLQGKLEKLTPTKKVTNTTAVGGVRGAKNDEATDIYWKGKDKPVEIDEEEIHKFNLAVETKFKGNNELALKQFEEFLAEYPQSSLRVEGLQATEKIRMEIAAASQQPAK